MLTENQTRIPPVTGCQGIQLTKMNDPNVKLMKEHQLHHLHKNLTHEKVGQMNYELNYYSHCDANFIQNSKSLNGHNFIKN